MGYESRVRKLADCADFQEGYVNPSQTKPEYFGDDVRWLRAVDLNDSFVYETSRRLSEEGYLSAGKAAQLFPADSLAISKSGTIGRLGILKNPMCGNRAVINVRPREDVVDTRFLFYILLTTRPRIIAAAAGSVQKNLYVSELGSIDVELPPLSEQRVIAEVLGSLDDKIELNRRMNRTLESMAQALFKSWFVDFDPVHANAAGNPTLPPDLADLFPDAFESSSFGDIPEGWEVRPIGDVVDCVGGGTPSTKNADYWEGGMHRWATPKDLSNLQSPLLLDTSRRLTDAGVEKVSSGLLDVGTVLLSSRAPVGYLAITTVPVAINQGFIALKATEALPSEYLVLWCESMMNTIKGAASGTTFAEISKKAFRPLPMLLPPPAVTAAFAEMTKPLYQRMISNLEESRTLAALRDTLLPRLLSGDLDVLPLARENADEQEGRE